MALCLTEDDMAAVKDTVVAAALVLVQQPISQ